MLLMSSTKATNVLDSSSELADLIAGKNQNCDISNVSDDTRHSQSLNQVMSLTLLVISKSSIMLNKPLAELSFHVNQ